MTDLSNTDIFEDAIDAWSRQIAEEIDKGLQQYLEDTLKEEAKAQEPTLCKCPMQELMRNGCKCGGK